MHWNCDYRACIFTGVPPAGASFEPDLDAGIDQHYLRVRRRSMALSDSAARSLAEEVPR